MEHIEAELNLLLSAPVGATEVRKSIVGGVGLAPGERLMDRITIVKRYDDGKVAPESVQWKVFQSAIQVCIRVNHLAKLLHLLDTALEQTHFVSAVKSKYNPVVSKLYDKHYLHGSVGPYLMQLEQLPDVQMKEGVPVAFFQMH